MPITIFNLKIEMAEITLLKSFIILFFLNLFHSVNIYHDLGLDTLAHELLYLTISKVSKLYDQVPVASIRFRYYVQNI